jgi:hypothetical protein
MMMAADRFAKVWPLFATLPRLSHWKKNIFANFAAVRASTPTGVDP